MSLSVQAGETLSALIRFKTVSSGDPDRNEWLKLRAHLRRAFPETHERCECEASSDYGLLYKLRSDNPAGAPAALLCGHLDVPDVPGADFSGESRDGFIAGAGAASGKARLACMFAGFEEYLASGRSPARDVYIALSHDRFSAGRDGAAAFARTFAERGLKFGMILDEGDGIARLKKSAAALPGIAEKGYMRVRVSAAASAPNPLTCAAIVAEACARTGLKLSRRRTTPVVKSMFSKLEPRSAKAPEYAPLFRTTYSVASLEASRSGDAPPGAASAEIDVRLLHGDSCRDAELFLRDLFSDLGVTLTVTRACEPSPVSPKNSAAYKILEASIKTAFGGIPVVASLYGGCSDSSLYYGFSREIFRFSPFFTGTRGAESVYAPGERIRADGLEAAAAFYRELFLHF